MEKYIKSITALNTLALTSDKKEVDRFAESDIFWVANKKGMSPRKNIHKGDIYQFEFGKNYTPEMSYEHRGLVIGISRRLLYVLPICSYTSTNKDHLDAYHPVDNPDSKSDFYLLKGSEFSFLKRDSVLKLNDLRTVSVARIKYSYGKASECIDPKSDTYKAIEKIVFTKYFQDYSFNYDKLLEDNKAQSDRIKELEQMYDDLSQKKDEVDALLKSVGEIIKGSKESDKTVVEIKKLMEL